MDLLELVNLVGKFVLPFLPSLAKDVNGSSDQADVSADVKLAADVWQALNPMFESNPIAKAAVDDYVKDPDSDSLGALKVQVKKALSENSVARETIEKKLSSLKLSVTVTASGERSVAIGGSVGDTQITTGDVTSENEHLK